MFFRRNIPDAPLPPHSSSEVQASIDSRDRDPSLKSNNSSTGISFNLASSGANSKSGATGKVADRGIRNSTGWQGRGTGGFKRPRPVDDEVDPLDPTGERGARWSQGLVVEGDRSADSTASGPLFQQRPYPAPGSILRAQGQGDAAPAKVAGISPAFC